MPGDDQRTASTPTAAAGTGAAHAADGSRSVNTAEWPVKAADTVDSVVATVHDSVIRPLVLVARGLVFGLLVATLGVLLVAMASVGLIRLLDVYAFPGRVWASYALVGFVLTVGGLLLWTRRRGPQP